MEGTHEAIIDEALWNTVHKKVKSHARPNKATGMVHNFSRIAVCMHCGYSVRPHKTHSYVRIPITFLPLTEYPLDETVQFEAKSQVYTESAESYGDIIRMRLTSKEEQWPRWKYDIRDLNDDGVEEMIWSEDGRIWIYTTVDGAIISYNMVSDGSLRPCDDGIVEAIQHYGPVNKT